MQQILILILLTLLSLSSSCGAFRSKNIDPEKNIPPHILWAWERPEDLKFIDRKKFGVAFLEQTLKVNSSEVIHVPRRQPLRVESKTYLIAVTRIETERGSIIRESDSGQIVSEIVSRIVKSSKLENVKGVQIDFDAVESERGLYQKIIREVKQKLGPGSSLSITALASWCAYDTWLKDLPIDEAIPMLFDLGADRKQITSFLKNGEDWNEPLCRKSYGLSVNQPINLALKESRRRYYFNSRSWKKIDLEKIG